MTNAVLLLLSVTLMPTASILVDLITAPVRQDTVAMEKIAKVAENSLNPGTYKGGGGGGVVRLTIKFF